MPIVSLAAHFWTVWPLLRHRLRPWRAPASQPWSTTVCDAERGELPLKGRITWNDRGRLVVLVHGLGGSAESLYMARAAAIADQLGLSSLRLNMRGSDRDGADLYHAGLWQDIRDAVASDALSDVRQLWILGFSVGGHVVLRYGLQIDDPRVRAIAAVGSPLDLEATVEHFDQPHRWPYRRHVLRGLKEIYRAVDHRQPLSVPLERVLAVRGLREWDEMTVVPRFAFGTTDHYYASQSVGPRLGELRRPALLVAGEGDPMVTAASVRQGLTSNPDPKLEIAWVPRGGHMGFPPGLDLGFSTDTGIDSQVMAWLIKR